MHARVACGQVTSIRSDPLPQCRLARPLHADTRAEREAIRRRLLDANVEPVVCASVFHCLIEEEEGRASIVCDYDIHIAIIVDVAECGAAADAGLLERGTSVAARLLKA